jgi:hypothetical protein
MKRPSCVDVIDREYIMKLRILLSAALLASSMLVTGAAQAKSLVYCSEGSPENFTPAINTTGTSFDAARPVYNRLVQFTPGTTQVEAALAESWTISDDGKTLTFKLRPGIKFHSGVNGFTPTRDLTAEDVIWSFDRQWKPDHPFAKVSGGSYDYFNDMSMPDLLESVAKGDDDLTVVINGGITSLDDACRHLDHVDGVMLGRAAYQTPWLLHDVDNRLFGAGASTRCPLDVVIGMKPYVAGQLARGVPLHAITRHMLGLFHGQPGGRLWRRVLSEEGVRPGAGLEVLDRALAEVAARIGTAKIAAE